MRGIRSRQRDSGRLPGQGMIRLTLEQQVTNGHEKKGERTSVKRYQAVQVAHGPGRYVGWARLQHRDRRWGSWKVLLRTLDFNLNAMKDCKQRTKFIRFIL